MVALVTKAHTDLRRRHVFKGNAIAMLPDRLALLFSIRTMSATSARERVARDLERLAARDGSADVNNPLHGQSETLGAGAEGRT